jgi:hypothetical protein
MTIVVPNIMIIYRDNGAGPVYVYKAKLDDVDAAQSKQLLYWLLSDELLNAQAQINCASFAWDPNQKPDPATIFGPPYCPDNSVLMVTDLHMGDKTKGTFAYHLSITIGTKSFAVQTKVKTSDPTIKNK